MFNFSNFQDPSWRGCLAASCFYLLRSSFKAQTNVKDCSRPSDAQVWGYSSTCHVFAQSSGCWMRQTDPISNLGSKFELEAFVNIPQRRKKAHNDDISAFHQFFLNAWYIFDWCENNWKQAFSTAITMFHYPYHSSPQSSIEIRNHCMCICTHIQTQLQASCLTRFTLMSMSSANSCRCSWVYKIAGVAEKWWTA